MAGHPAADGRSAMQKLLACGDIALEGQIPWSSNYTFVAQVTLGQANCLAIYKPSRGAQPLYDFDADTLCQRELAAYLLSQFLGWPKIPETVLRDGPLGYGSLQQVIEADLNQSYFELRDRPELIPAFKHLAAFAELVNNADRKGGHVLLGPKGMVWSVDHGLCFHVEPKLRSVIWEYAGQPLGPELRNHLERLVDALGGELGNELTELLSRVEVAALGRRLAVMLARGTHCLPSEERRNVPYPLV